MRDRYIIFKDKNSNKFMENKKGVNFDFENFMGDFLAYKARLDGLNEKRAYLERVYFSLEHKKKVLYRRVKEALDNSYYNGGKIEYRMIKKYNKVSDLLKEVKEDEEVVMREWASEHKKLENMLGRVIGCCG